MQQKLERHSPKLGRFLKEIEIQFKWLFIWLFLRALERYSRRHQRPLDPRRVKRVLFLRQDKIGDMVVMLTTLHTLKHHRPDVEIGVLASPANHRVIEHDPAVSHIHIYRKSLGQIRKTLKDVRRYNYDVVVDGMTGASVTSLVIAMMCAPRAYRIGTGKEAFRKYYDYYTLELMNHGRRLHISEVFRATLEPLGISLAQGIVDGRIVLSESLKVRGKELLAQIREPHYSGLIMLNVSAGKTDRSWHPNKFLKLVEFLSRRYPQQQFLASYAPNEHEFAKRAVAAGGKNVTLLPTGVSIMELIALIERVDAVISVDTSICHIAANLDVPLLAMYTGNAVNFTRWYPYGRRVWAVKSPNWKSVDGITFEQMQTAVEKFMEELARQSVIARQP